MKHRKRSLATSLNLALLLALALSLPAPALGQGSDRVNEVSPAPATPQTPGGSENWVAPVSTPEPIDCSKPLPGERTTLGVDDEILIAYGDQSLETMIAKYDNTSNTDAHLKHFWNWGPDDDDEYDLYQPRSVAITTADLDLDNKAEVVTAIGNNNPGQLEVVSIKNAEASGGDLHYDLWTSSSHDRQGDNMGYLMAAAAGDLDGALGGNASEEVAVAFQDEDQHLQVVLLDGESDGGITYMGYWASSDHYRYQMSDIAAAVGDLDGDGYDDEIVLALSDYYEVLQVIVLEYNGSGGLTELAYARYSGAYEVDVTTGVFSGDGKDQFAVAFKDSNKWLHVALFEYDSSGGSVSHLSSWDSNAQYRDNVDYVSVASGDIDGDRWDEIVTAFADRNDYFQAVTLDADSGSLKVHSSYWGNDYATDISYVSVGAGDIDGDGRAEIVSSFSDYDSLLQVLSFDDKSSCPCSDNGDGLHLRDQRQDWTARFTYLAMGDVDGNNLYGDYTGKCEQLDETRLISMVNRPPYWEDLNPQTDVGYGNSIKGGDEEENHVTTSYGGSVTFDSSFDFGDFEIGPSFTKDWEHSTTQSWTHGSSLETRAGWTSPEDGLVPINTVTYYAYQYQKRDGSGLARVSIPVSTQTDAKLLSFWNQSGGAQDLFPDSWVPAYRTAWQDQQELAALSSDFSSDDLFWGEGADFHDFNGNGTPDYLFAVIVGPEDAGNNVFYRIGYDVTSDGIPQTYSPWIPIWNSLGNLSSGLGAAVTELNGNNTPELVVAWVDNPSGDNRAFYRVSWDLDANGKSGRLGDWIQIPGMTGSSTQGAGLDILDLNGNGDPELFFGWIDDPADGNQGYYQVAWDLDESGDPQNGWSSRFEIESTFGPHDSGLGLTVDDMDGNGQNELIAAWVRNPAGENNWGYSVGENLDGNARVDFWVPGHGIPGWVGGETAGAALASADLVADASGPELFVGWIDNPADDQKAYSRMGKYWTLGGEVDQRPTDIDDPTAKDGQFKVKLYDKWWQTNGDSIWRWDTTQDQDGNDLEPILVSLGGGQPYWKVDRTQFSDYSTESSDSTNYEVGGEATFLGIGAEGSKTWGFEQGQSYTVSWETGLLMDGQNTGIPYDPNHDHCPWQYLYVPFTYMQEAVSKTGIKQTYMVLDYFVSCSGSSCAPCSGAEVVRASSPLVTPGMPIIDSPSHPNPAAWYAVDTATFTWRQPDGDPAVVDGYRWYLDRSSDTIPSGMSFGLTDTTSYEELSDGLWYLHLRARDEGGEWSETAHRAARVDTQPPQVEITLDPPYPIQGDDWYNVPVTADVSADDGSGSGLASIETSTDGLTWLPYTGPLLFDVDTPSTTLWARATDLVGHVSEPVSTTFGLDLTLPSSVEAPGCWESGGGCVAGVITDTAGNQRLHLNGQLDGSLSGERGLGIQINGDRWTAADEVGGGRWSFTSDTELGAGCYTFQIQSEDWAGNIEPPHAFGAEVVWHPRERPDLSGSRLSVVPQRVRPGDTVAFTLVVPNSGSQETWVPIRVTLPPGLHVLPEDISSDGVYDDATRTISWPPRYLWPGQERRLTFGARVDAGLPATTLDVSLTALGSWPIVDTCPAGVLSGFRDLETTVERTTTLSVDPTLPDSADTRPPASPFLRVEAGSATNHRQVQLRINAGTDAAADPRWMYLREWTLSASSGTWTAVQDSSWLPYSPSYAWTLSRGAGVKYLGVWLADAAGNVSLLDRSSLTFTNLLEGSQSLPDGQRIQYRFPLRPKELAVFNAIGRAGNPDLYVWKPRNGWRPDYAASGTGTVDAIGFWAAEGGVYLVEVKAEGDVVYQLLLAGDVAPRAPTQFDANAPDHPLTVSNPLSAGAAVAPTPPALNELYLPIVGKDG